MWGGGNIRSYMRGASRIIQASIPFRADNQTLVHSPKLQIVLERTPIDEGLLRCQYREPIEGDVLIDGGDVACRHGVRQSQADKTFVQTAMEVNLAEIQVGQLAAQKAPPTA